VLDARLVLVNEDVDELGLDAVALGVFEERFEHDERRPVFAVDVSAWAAEAVE
jgi:hypothetical protein